MVTSWSGNGRGRSDNSLSCRLAAPAPVLTAALYARFGSPGEADFAGRLLSAMRFEFGGYIEKQAGA